MLHFIVELTKLKNKIKHSFIIAMFFIFSLGFFCEPDVVAAANESDIYLTIENFEWKEFNASGSQLLKESGALYGIGISTKSQDVNLITRKFRGELFSGGIDYDGQTQAGTPVKSDTDYLGFKIEGDIGKVVSEKSSLEPFAGLGFRWWTRDIKSASNAIGYEERWYSIYGRLGIRGDHIVSDQLKIFVEAGVKLPMYTENEVDLTKFGLQKVTIEPGNEPSAFAEAGFKRDRLKITLYYEGMRFSQSEPDNRYRAFIQPESQADMYGVKIGMVF